jgi:small-conductance mechanosensitive channel
MIRIRNRARFFLLTTALAALMLPLEALAQEDAAKSAAKFFEVFRVSGLVPALLVLAVAIVLLRFISGAASRLGRRFAEHRLLIQQISTVLRFAIYFVTFILLVRSLFRLDDKTMLAISGTIAVAMGFALKDLAASVLAGIMILFDRPFQVGDRVTFGNYYGEITVIGLRSVRLVTLDDSVVTIPNNKFLTDVVVSGNAGALDMQIVIDFFIAQDADVKEAKRIVTEAVRTSRFVYLEKPVVVLVNDVIHQNYVATRLRAKAYVLDVRYEKAFETDVTERVKRGFASAKVSPPNMIHLGGATPSTTPSPSKEPA